MRATSKVAPDWWDYTTLDEAILNDAARLSAGDLLALSRQGFTVKLYDTIEDFYLAEDSEEAGKLGRERWEDMAKHDRKEFACIIGEERLVQWALGESDSFGISSLEEFLDITAGSPEFELAGYDHEEREVDRVETMLEEEIGFKPTVAYRCN